jgi:2-desacetyl-2-hydroxyethyl bacteriochlorophyllide A dehydrogenase
VILDCDNDPRHWLVTPRHVAGHMKRSPRAQALWFVAPRSVAVRECELPEPRPDQVLVRTAFSGISPGTELLAYRGEIDETVVLDETLPALSGQFSYPFRYGYSCVGSVEGGGGLGEGTPVFAFHPHQDRFVVDAEDAVVTDGIDARAATLFPLVETALQVSLEADTEPGAVVVVAGLGVVGLLVALLVQRGGAQVLGSEPLSWRRELAISLGVEAVEPGDLESRVAAATGERGTPLLIEASGNPVALAQGLPVLAHEGTALVVSWYGTKSVALPLGAEFHRRRLTIRSTQVSTIPARLAGEWSRERRRRAARDLMTELPLEVIATHVFPFAEAPTAYGKVDAAEPGLLHAALCYE